MANTATIPVGGGTVLLSFDAPGGGWGSTFTVGDDLTFPVITVGAGGNNNLLHMDDISVPAAVVSTKLEVTVNLTAWAFAADTGSGLTITVPAGFLTDNLGNQSPAMTAVAVTNNSTKTIGSAYSRFKGVPVVAWATRDKWPVVGNTARLAFDAHDSWTGIEYVEVTFNTAVTILSDAAVTHVSGNIYRISSYRKIDYFGYGNAAPYWYLDVDVSGLAEGNGPVATITKVRTLDGVDHNPTAGINGCIPTSSRTITCRKNPTIRYLDSTATGGAGTGLSWADAYTDWSTCEAAITTAIDIVKIAPGTYTETSMTLYTEASRTKYVIWRGDTSVAGDGSGVIKLVHSVTLQIRSYQALMNMTMEMGPDRTNQDGGGGTIRTGDPGDHIGFENVIIKFAGKLDDTPWATAVTTHAFIVHVIQDNGYRGFNGANSGNSYPVDNVVHDYEMYGSGTVATGSMWNSLWEFVYAHDNCKGGFPPDTHSEFIHPVTTGSGFTGAVWTEATKRLTLSNAFTSIDFTYASQFNMFYHSNGAGNLAEQSYRMVEKVSNSVVVLQNSPFGADATGVNGNFLKTCGMNWICRYCTAVDNGSPTGQLYNFMNIETPMANAAIYGSVAYSYQGSQQLSLVNPQSNNLQFIHNTLLAYDNVGDVRGISLSANKASAPYAGKGLLIRGNILHNMSSGISVGSGSTHTQGRAKDYVRKRMYGNNLMTQQDADSASNIFTDGSVKTSTGGTASLLLTDTSLSSPNFTPTTSSPAYRLNYSALPTGYAYDMAGNPFGGEAGAMQIGDDDPDPVDDPPTSFYMKKLRLFC